MERIDRAIEVYCKVRTGHEKARYEKDFPNLTHPTIEADPNGKRFTRIVRVDRHTTTGEVIARSAVCFVERATGKVWKAAGWKGPALNFPRGDVYAVAEGLV